MSRKGEKWTEQERLAHSGQPQGWLDTRDGYWRFRIGRKTFLLHRYVMEQHIGRKLNRNEIVHHVNGDRSDNRLENLRVLSHEDHVVLHSTGTKRSEEARAKMREAWTHRAPPSEETRRKTSESLRLRWQSKKATPNS